MVHLADYPINWSAIANKPNFDAGGIYRYTYKSDSTYVITVLISASVSFPGVSGSQAYAFYMDTSGAWKSAPSGWANSATKLF